MHMVGGRCVFITVRSLLDQRYRFSDSYGGCLYVYVLVIVESNYGDSLL